MLGGAIEPNKVKIKEAKPADMPFESSVDQILKQAIYMTPTGRLQEFVGGVTDMIPTSQPAYDTYNGLYYRRDETALHKVLKEKVTGRGSRHDPPRIARAVWETLKYHPELAHAYLQGNVKAV